jgi:hypothetical protein
VLTIHERRNGVTENQRSLVLPIREMRRGKKMSVFGDWLSTQNRAQENVKCRGLKNTQRGTFQVIIHGSTAPCGPRPRHFKVSRSHSDAPHCGTPLDEWSARRRDLYRITHNTHSAQIFTPPVGFEPAIPSKRAAANSHLRPQGHRNRHFFRWQSNILVNSSKTEVHLH